MAKIIMAHNGTFEQYSDDLFDAVIKLEFPVQFTKEEDTFEVVYGNVEEKISPKFERIPLSIFQEALAFLEWCYEEKHTEGFIAHRYIDGKWSNVVFHQWNSATSCCYHPELDLQNATRVMADTHSHPPKKAGHGSSYHSSTDDLDERKNNGIFIVVTGFTPMDCDPNIYGCIRGRRFRLPKAEMMFDISKYEKNPTFPEAWKERVGSSPCKGCERKRDVERTGSEEAEKRAQYEDEKRFRLVPKPVLDAWKTEVAKERETPGKALKATWDAYKKRMMHAQKLIRCDSHQCRKLVYSGVCTDCKIGFGTDTIINSVADMLDEYEAMTNDQEAIGIFTSCIEEELGHTKVHPVPVPNPYVPKALAQNPVGTKVPESPHVLLILSDKPCDEKCEYRNFAHRHFATRDDLEKHFKLIASRKTRTECVNEAKTCTYPGGMACDNGCITFLGGLLPKECPSRFLESLPTCSSPSCKDAGHLWSTCEIKKALTQAVCPTKVCENLGHQHMDCEVRVLKEKLTAVGAFRQEEEDDTKRFEKCVNTLCIDANHTFSYCPERFGKHKSDPVSPAVSSTVITKDGVVIFGDTMVCPEDCTYKGRVHTHELDSLDVHDYWPGRDTPSC